MTMTRMKRMSKPRATLTGKQRAFVLAYFSNGFVGWRAAQAAGYSGDENALMSMASTLLRNPKVQREVEKQWDRLAMPANEVVARLTEMARGDLDSVLDDTGSFDIKLARARGKTYLIKKQKITEKFIPVEGADDIMIRTVELEFHDAQAALGTLAKYHGLLTERLKLDDWRSEAVDALRKGEITPEALRETLHDDSLADELFRQAGVKVG